MSEKVSESSLMSDWSPDNIIDPENITTGSNKKALWLCPKGHDYSLSIYKKNKGAGCNICAGKVIVPGINDVTTTHPEISQYWDYDKNDVAPTEVSQGSSKKAWFVYRGEKILQRVSSFVKKIEKAQKNNNEIEASKNNSFNLNPNITINSIIYEETVLLSWGCNKGHHWKVPAQDSSYYITGCPECAKLTN